MDEDRKSLYYLEKVDNAEALEKAIAKIKGVTFAHIDREKATLQYEIDEWSSDYDVFTEVMRIVAEHGDAIDFDHTEEAEAEKEQEELLEKQSEEEESSEDDEEESADEDEKTSEKKPKKKLSDTTWRIIELSLAVVCFVVAMFLKNHQTFQFILLAVSFAVAGYDALYEAFVKITKKVIISDELVYSLASLACIFLGKVDFAVAAMVLYSIVNFARKLITEKMSKDSVGWDDPEKVIVTEESGTSEKEFEKSLAVGDVVSLSQDERVSFDGKSETAGKVLDINGAEREVGAGETVFAGERCLVDMDVEVTALQEDTKYSEYNNFVKKAGASATKLATFVKKKEQIYNAVVLGICLIIAFVMPVFSETYAIGLERWGYTAVIIACVSGLGYYLFASNANMLCALKAGKKSGAFIASVKSAEKIAKSKEIYVDENILYDGEELKKDSHGAMRELKDNDEDVTFATTKSDEEAEEICKALNVASYCNRKDDEEKLSAMNSARENGATLAISSKDYMEEPVKELTKAEKKALKNKKKGGTICFDCQKNGYKGDGAVMHDKIAYLPYIVKLAKRTVRIEKTSAIFGIIVKAVLAVLAVLGIADLWWAVLIDSAVSVFIAFIAFMNGSEVY